MSEHFDDAQRRLEQQALRNVRNLLDKLEAEDSGAYSARGLLTPALVIFVCIALLALSGYLSGRAPPPARHEVTVDSTTSSIPARKADKAFRILRKDIHSAAFEFDHQVFEVEAGPDGNIERAIVKRMAQIIRERYSADFRWDSRRLGRVVTPSARPEDEGGLEDFLMREFFGMPEGRSPPPTPARREYVGSGRGTRYESYVNAFTRRIERMANAHYPEELRGLSGSAQLTTGIRSDGSILSIEINRSSGDPKIDAAATNFVRQAFPFDALSAHGLNDVDVLYITRTFEFRSQKSSVLIPP